MDFSSKLVKFRVFFDKHNKGATAAVYLLDKAIRTGQMLSLAGENRCDASVFVDLSEKPARVKAFNLVNEIQLCGHGVLAAAFHLNQLQSCQELVTNSESVKVRLDSKNRVWIGFKEIKTATSIAKDIDKELLGAAIGVRPVNLASVGSESGYCIVEISRDLDLSKIDMDIAKLKRATTRALILTQKSTVHSDFNLRYFAPHYGVNEDVATGSANRILATYWKARLNKNHFIAMQLSKKGAFISSKIEKNIVWISGNIDFLHDD